MREQQLYRILITGRVQGVGFRWNVAREANKLGIGGYVKNLPDGDVFVEAEGPGELLDNFVEWCRKSPGMSEVKSVIVEKGQPVHYTDFRIEQ